MFTFYFHMCVETHDIFDDPLSMWIGEFWTIRSRAHLLAFGNFKLARACSCYSRICMLECLRIKLFVSLGNTKNVIIHSENAKK